MRCLLVGNYGVDNLGDEALREYFVTRFPEVQWLVVTATGEYPRLPFGLRSLFRPWWRTVRAIAGADAVVYGGGSLLTDVESWTAPVMWWWYAFIAKLLGKKVILAFQGIGPVNKTLAKWCTEGTIRRADFLSVRDEASMKRLATLVGPIALRNKIVVQSFDPAIAIFKASSHQSTKKLIIVPRANVSHQFIQDVEHELAKGWNEVVILLLEPDAEKDAEQKVRRVVKNLACQTVECRTFDILKCEVASAGFVLTQRFHGAIAALANGVPYRAVPQAHGDKLDQANAFDASRCEAQLQTGEDALRAFLTRKG